jgi:hypothetical protein
MKRVEFIYRIETEVELTGRELAVIYHCARSHYDMVCKQAFQVGGFGWGWMNQLLDGGETDESIISFDLDTLEERFADRTVQVKATSQQIQTCAKILEVANYATLPEREGTKLNLDAAATAWKGLCTLMREVREESQRLNGSTG